MEIKQIKSIAFLAGIFLCKAGCSQQTNTVHTHLVNYIQEIAILSEDTVYCGFMGISHKGSFYIADVNIDSISLEPTQEYLVHFERKSIVKKLRRKGYNEIRHQTTILSEHIDTVINLFAMENDDRSIIYNKDNIPLGINIFRAKVETSYLINILEKKGLIAQSDSLWIMVFPEYVHNSSSQYYIYQYCTHTQKLHLSIISFTHGFVPQIVFSSSAKLNKKDLDIINKSMIRFDQASNQKNCLNSSIFAAFVHRYHDNYEGVFRSYLCEDNRFFNFDFIFTGKKYFNKGPEIFNDGYE